MVPTAWLYALAGGALIGLASSLVLFAHGKVTGISGIYGGLFVAGTKDRLFRVAFLAGLALAGLLLLAFRPWSFSTPGVVPMGMVVVAGLLVGFGTRLGNGCTSGHGVCGLSRMSPRSLASTVTFIAVGMATTVVVRALFGGAS